MTEEHNAYKVEHDETNFNTMPSGTPPWVRLAMVALAAVSILGVGVGWGAITRARSSEQAFAAQTQTLQQNVDTLSQRLSRSEETNAQLQNGLSAVTDRLKMTQGEITSGKRQSTQIRDEYNENSKKIDTVQAQLGTKANADDVAALGGDVNGVKSDLEATKNNLNMARGEFGTLIARNHDEIDELRRLGERDYSEFTLTGKGKRSKVGNLMLELRGTNTKKNQFTVALYVDDMRLEKKNRSVDEPIYFYTRGTHTPLELVINEVGKDKVTGYLSAPKPQATSASAAPSEN